MRTPERTEDGTGFLDWMFRSRTTGRITLAQLWAADELLRGVNPFRRLLGFAVLAWFVFSLVKPG